ncbi:MAG TPA: hypothetical protein VHG30_12450, partial [Microvirga sp.]|nr:hypothetical protein [Microvirga sp.]
MPYALAAIPAWFVLERRNWTEAAAVSTPSPSFPWERYPWAQAILSFTRGLGAATSGDVAAAQRELVGEGARASMFSGRSRPSTCAAPRSFAHELPLGR